MNCEVCGKDCEELQQRTSYVKEVIDKPNKDFRWKCEECYEDG